MISSNARRLASRHVARVASSSGISNPLNLLDGGGWANLSLAASSQSRRVPRSSKYESRTFSSSSSSSNESKSKDIDKEDVKDAKNTATEHTGEDDKEEQEKEEQEVSLNTTQHILSHPTRSTP